MSASFVSQVSFAATKPFTDAFPAEAEAQQAAFDTPSYAQVRGSTTPARGTVVEPQPTCRPGRPSEPVSATVAALEPQFHLPAKLLEDKPSGHNSGLGEIAPFIFVGAVVILGAFFAWRWISGATSTSQ